MGWDGMRYDAMRWVATAIAQVFSSLGFSLWPNLGYK